MGRLLTHVHVRDEAGENHAFGPDDKVPGWAAKLITNPCAWESDADAAEAEAAAKAAEAAEAQAAEAAAKAAADALPAEAAAGTPESKQDKAFSQLNREELETLAAAEEVNITDLGTNKEIRLAISTQREAK